MLENELEVVNREAAEDRLQWACKQLELEQKCVRLQERLNSVSPS